MTGFKCVCNSFAAFITLGGAFFGQYITAFLNSNADNAVVTAHINRIPIVLLVILLSLFLYPESHFQNVLAHLIKNWSV
jgi:hypothetical protein